MKTFFRNSLSIFLALLVLFSTLSFSSEKYYCLDKLVDVSFFSYSNNQILKIESFPDLKGDSFQERDCTNSLVKIIEGQNVLKTDSSRVKFDQSTFSLLFLYSYINLFQGSNFESVPFNDYPPPLLIRDIHVLNEVYLI